MLAIVVFVSTLLGLALWVVIERSGLVGSSDDNPRVAEALRKYGVEVISQSHVPHYATHSSRVGEKYRFTGTDKAGLEVSGEVFLTALGAPDVSFDVSRFGARTARARAALEEQDQVDETTLDPEEQIRREVARRLDAMQADRTEFLAHDTNFDGMVDADEWTAARARVEAEVRAEIDSLDGDPTPTREEVEPAPLTGESEASEEPAEVLPDGHW